MTTTQLLPERLPPLSESGRQKLQALSSAAGLRRVHILGWRDAVDPAAGGSELHVSTIAALWAQAGIDVTIRTSATKGLAATEFRDGYRVVRRGSRYSVFPRAVAAEIMGRHGQADGLIEIWNGMPFLSPLWWRSEHHNVWLHHVHGAMWTMMLGRVGHLGILLEERIAPRFYRSTQMVTLSESSRSELEGLGLARSRIEVVPPGINPQFVPGGEPSPTPLAVVVGRLAPVKRVHLMVEAALAVRAAVPDFELVIVGDGPRREALVEQIARAGASEWITLAGHVSDAELVELYQRAWVLTSASEREGWGMTITEAAACGTPAVVTRISGHTDAVVDRRTGLLADTIDELAAGMITVCTDDTLRSAMSAAALEHASEFSWEQTAIRTFEILARR